MIKHTLFAAATVLAVAVPLEGAAGPKHCPPGHAKKGWCGGGGSNEAAYRDGYRDGQRDAWRRGDRLPRERYVVIEDYRSRGYPRPAQGEIYVRAGGDIFLIAVGTGLILEALTN
ncbi:MAG: RcnB family protein [Pseudomonadota bacterium]